MEVETINNVEEILTEMRVEASKKESPESILAKRIAERLDTLSKQYYNDIDDLINTLENQLATKNLSTRMMVIKRLSKVVSKSYDVVVKLFKREDF